jgi:sulfotransferase
MRKLIFVAGLPRSGSTLLQNILAQNPRFYCTPTSSVVGLMLRTRQSFLELPQFRNLGEKEFYRRMKMVLANIPYSYYWDHEVVFDKNRLWIHQIEMLNWLFDKENVKIIAPVRDPAEIVASFEMLWRHSRKAVEPFLGEGVDMSTLQLRFNYWVSEESPLGASYNQHKDAVLSRGFGDQVHFVQYDDLTTDPERVLSGVYSFIQELHFDHQFDTIEQVVDEDDRIHGYLDLHKIRPKIGPNNKKSKEILGENLARRLWGQDFWNT